MNDYFMMIIRRADIDQKIPIEQTEEFKTICNYFDLAPPNEKLEFVQKLDSITLNDVLEQIYLYNYPLFTKIEKRGKPEITRLNNIFTEAKILLLTFVKEALYCVKIQ
jgi:hypothetical protein